MGSPYGLQLVENCLICKLRSDNFFCALPSSALEAFEKIKFPTAYPRGAVLFVEGQPPRGIYMLCKGRVKLSVNSAEGKTLILKIAEPGEVLGLHACVSGINYELTAETIQPCQVNFVKREDFLKFLQEHGVPCEIVFKISEHYRPNIADEIKSKQIDLIINTPRGKTGAADGATIRKAAIKYKVPYVTTTSAAKAAVVGIAAARTGKAGVKSLQSYHADIKG